MTEYDLKFFDFRTKTLTTESVESEDKFNCETIVSNYYSSKGFDVIKLTSNKGLNINQSILEKIVISKGTPDFFVISKTNKDDFFFCEVKSANDTLKYEQFEWAFNCEFNSLVVFVLPKDRFDVKSLLVTLSLEEKSFLYKKALHSKDSMSLTLVKLLREDMENNKEGKE